MSLKYSHNDHYVDPETGVSPVTPEQMLEASIKSFHGDNSLLFGLIHRNIHDKDRENDLERGR